MIVRALFAVATVGAALHLVAGAGAWGPTLPERLWQIFALKLLLLAAVGLVCVCDRRRAWPARLTAACEEHPAVVLAAIVLASIALVFAITPQITFGLGQLGLGYGHDGEHYGAMTEHFGSLKRPVPAPFCYRFLLPMLVHWSGLDTFTGFRLVDLLSHALASILTYRVARDLALPRPAALLAVAFLALLKFGFRFTIYYPVLIDGFGQLLLMAVLWATLERRHPIYVAAMVLAVASRENLLALLPFNALFLVRTGTGARRFVLAAGLQVLPVVAYVASRKLPLFVPDLDFPLTWRMQVFAGMLFNDPGIQGRAVLATLNALGVLAILAVLYGRRVVDFAGRRWEWAWYGAANIVLALSAGGDLDRFATWLAPGLLLVVLAVAWPREGPPPRRWLHWLAVQAVAMEAIFPWDPSEAFYLSRFATHATGLALSHLAAFAWALLVVVVVVHLYDALGRPARPDAVPEL